MSPVFPSFRTRCGKVLWEESLLCIPHVLLLCHLLRSCYHFYLLRSKFTYWIQVVFSNAIKRAGCPRARKRESQARVFHDDHGVVRPLQPRAEQHRDATAAQRGLEELDQQAATCREPDGEEVSEPCRLGHREAGLRVIYIGHILRFTIVAFWNGGVGAGRWEICFAIYSVCNYSLVRRQDWNMRIPSIPLRVECNINSWLRSA